MTYLIGIVLALATALTCAVIGFERRTFYATIVIVVAHYYVLFAVMAGAPGAIMIELGIMGLFVALAAVGYRRNVWIVALALAGHGAFDFVHGFIVTNPGVPAWWPPFCASFDIAAGLVLAWLIRRPTHAAAGHDAVRPV